MEGRLWVFRAFGVPEGKPFLPLWMNSNSENILHGEIEHKIPKEENIRSVSEDAISFFASSRDLIWFAQNVFQMLNSGQLSAYLEVIYKSPFVKK